MNLTQPTLTWIVLVHGEPEALKLIDHLLKFKAFDDKLLIVQDFTSELYSLELKRRGQAVVNHKLNNDFATHRNWALTHIKTDYVCFVDADELPTAKLILSLRSFLISHHLPDSVWCARLNKFTGVKPIHCLQRGWHLNHENLVNFPDAQLRIIKMGRGITYTAKLHSNPTLSKKHTQVQLPLDQGLHLDHLGTIEKQMKTNEQYDQTYSAESLAGKDWRRFSD